MDKGQHIRLLINTTNGSASGYACIAMATELTLHLSASTENSTSKDTTDATGGDWDEFDITQRSGDIQFGGLVNVGTDTAKTFNNILSGVTDTQIHWEICTVGSTHNRTVVKTICKGLGLITNVSAQGQVGQLATYQGTLQIVGPVTVGAD